MKKFLILTSMILTPLASIEATAKSPLPKENIPNANISMKLSEIFKPNPKIKTKINHSYWDAFLKKTVLYTGPSVREYKSSDTSVTGSHLKTGHESRLRLEGNKIFFSRFTDAHVHGVREYRKGLENLAQSHDITTFQKKEQLAYWINLHNALVVEAIGEHYPVRHPSKLNLKTQSGTLHDAKIVQVGNHRLSLREIREKIVYPNWDNPNVFYGFFQGDIGSPSIQRSAYDADNLDNLLDNSAREFINSLRGYSGGRVSKHYKALSPFYFKDYEADLSRHFKAYMRDDVLAEFAKRGISGIAKYETEIADLTGARPNKTVFSKMTTVQGPILTAVPADATGGGGPFAGSGSRVEQFDGAIGQFILELNDKFITARAKGIIKEGEVVIEDIDSDEAE